MKMSESQKTLTKCVGLKIVPCTSLLKKEKEGEENIFQFRTCLTSGLNQSTDTDAGILEK